MNARCTAAAAARCACIPRFLLGMPGIMWNSGATQQMHCSLQSWGTIRSRFYVCLGHAMRPSVAYLPHVWSTVMQSWQVLSLSSFQLQVQKFDHHAVCRQGRVTCQASCYIVLAAVLQCCCRRQILVPNSSPSHRDYSPRAKYWPPGFYGPRWANRRPGCQGRHRSQGRHG